MKLLTRYLRSRRGVIALFCAFALIFAAAFALYRLPMAAVWYPAALCLLTGAGGFIVDYLRVRRRHEALEGLKRSVSALLERLPEADGVEAADYREIAGLLHDARLEDSARAEAALREMTDYYTLWAHQIKTPIAAMRLRLQDSDSADARALLQELGRVERYVEMVLTYVRLEGGDTDYVIRPCDLDALLRRVFRRFAGEFIARRLRLEYAPVDATVLTDEKWLGFVLEQVLSNALKYTPSGAIAVYMEAPLTLCVRDTGIGIAPEDLPRIFDRSYTGLTGREHRQASGIGLYLCRRVCERLGHSIAAASAPGEGTVIRIDLSRREMPIE